MAGSTALNLSLLSRGIGQVQTNGHEKVEVILEPEDYHNYVHGTKRLFFPPLQARYPIITEHQTDEASVPSFPSPRELHEVLLPKTFTTRKGALLLFSEDMALKAQGRVQQRYEDVMRDNLEKSLSLNYKELHTVDDLTRSILSYGSKDPATETVHMKFVHNQRFWERNHERQMQPGFSAKRYLATWTKVWDDTVLSKLVNKGYISERNLVQYNIVGPNTRIRLSDDLSHIPMPYRLMRNMLICPGSISGYTFYRTVTDFNALDNVVEMEKHELAIELMNRLKSDSEVSTLGSIRVMSTKNGQTEDVLYSSLEKEDQAEVLTDLLVKSAISHALKQQQEFFDRKVADPSESKDISSNASVSLHGLTGHGIAVGELHAADRTVNRTATPPLPEFNMMDAVQTLLETSEAPHIIDGDLSLNSLARTPKGRPFGNTVPLDGHFPVLPDRPMELPPMSQTTSPPASHRSVEPSSKKITQSTEQLSPVSKRGSLPDSMHESMETVTMPPSIVGSAYPVLPSIMANTSVGDGGDQPSVNVEPPTPQHSILTELPQIPRQTITKGLHSGSRKSKRVLSARKSAKGHGEDEAGLKDQSRHSDEKRGSLQSLISIGGDSVFGGEFMGGASSRYNSMESLNQGSPGASHPAGMMKPAWKGSGQSLKSNASKRSPAQSIASATQIKGSVIIGPGGEIIHVGGSVGPRYDVTVAETTIPQDQIKTAEVLKSAFEDEERDRRAISAQQKADELKRMAQKKERELHSGDIDATMSMHGWSYQPLDVLELPRSPSVRSLPNLHKDYDLSSDESDSLHAKSISEQELINAITEHAHNIATGVLDRSGAGHDLTSDIEKAVTAWMIQHPPRPITRSRTAMDDCVISEVMAAQKQIKSASPSMGEYRELLKTQLTTALSDSNLNTADTDLPEDIIDDLTNKTVSPDDLELVTDEETGRILIQSKTPSPIQTLQVKEGHIYYTPQKGAAGQPSADNAESAKHLGPQISIPTETQPDLSELNIISYSTAELTPTETDQPLVMDAVATESPAPASVKSRTSGASLHDKDIITAPEESPSIAEIKTTPEPEPSTKVLEPEPVVAEPEPPAKAALVQKPDAVENQGADGLQSAVSGKSVGSVVFTSKSPPPASQPEKAKAVVNGIKETKEVVTVAEVIPVEPTQALDKRSADGQSVASMGSDQSKKNGAESPKKEPEKSKSPTKSKSKLGERDEFVVGMPKSKGELKDLYGAEETPAPKEEHKAPVVPKAKTKKSVKPKSSGVTGKKDGKKGKKKKRKGVEENTMDSASSPDETVSSSASPVKEEVKVEPLPEVIAPSPVPSDKSLSQKSDRTEEEEEDEGPDFIFVRDEFSPVMDEPEPPRSLMSSKSTAPSVGTTDTLETDESTSTGGSPDLHMISNKEARAAKRAAQAEKRRQEVERRRRERDELTKKEKSEAERQEQMRKDMEEEQRRREEEHRLRKQRERDERERDEADEDERERRQQLELERDMRMKDEFQRKLEEMKRKQQEEERKRQELQSERDREEEERRLEEEKMMSEMAEQERIEYEKQKAEEAAARQIQEELERIRLEEESRRAMEEAQRMVEEMARKQAEFERRLRFNRTLQLRNQGLEHSHGMSRAFVFSYYEFLQWLGIEISDLDFHKLVEKY